VYPFQQGDPTNAPDTYKGTVMMDENAMRRIKSKTADVDEMLTQMGRVVLQLAQATYTHEKLIRLVQPNGVTREITLNSPYYDEFDAKLLKTANDITRYHYDVTVVSGSTLPSSRWALLDYYRELYRDGLIDQQEVLMKSDVFNAPEILDRFGQMAQMQSTIQAQDNQIKQLSGDLQTAQREVMHARQETEIAQFKTRIGKTEAEVKSSASLFQARLDDELSNQRSQNGQR
jgi:hypothetical protein